MKKVLLSIFTWWNGQTVGVWWFTLRRGILAGQDQDGNRYYTEKGGERRWVVYHGEAEATRVPPEWQSWLHYTCDDAPACCGSAFPNMTGTLGGAYRPCGSLLRPGPQVSRDGRYEPWRPDA